MRPFVYIFLLLLPLVTTAQDALFNQFTTSNGLSSNHVYSVIEDAQGRVWFSSDQGLMVLEGFDFQSHQLAVPSDYVVGFSTSSTGEIWSYSINGRLNYLKNNQFKEIALNQKITAEIGNNLANMIAVDSKRNIWISSIAGGKLIRVNGTNLNVEDLSNSIEECTYWIRKIEDQTYILGSKGESNGKESILKVDLDQAQLEIPLSGKGGFSKSKFEILDNGTYLFSAGNELVAFNETVVLARLFTEHNIEAILQDSEGKVWIGLQQGGLLCFPTGEVNSKNRIEYLGNVSVSDIYEDSQNSLWITSIGDGVFNYNLNPMLTYESPEISEGLDSNSVRQQQAIRLDQDPNLLTLERVFWDTVAPDIFISSVEINNLDTSLLPNYELEADQNFIKIGFVGSLPGNPGLFQYRYKMNGVDNDWVYSSLNSVSYTMLPAGEYSFAVQAMSKEGKWSEESAEVNFNIHPYFYQSIWFQIGLIILLVAIMVFSVVGYIQSIRKKEEEKAKINNRIADLELMALRAQMNPHFLFNTLSSIQHFVSANNTEEALRYLSKFAKLMRVVLDNSKRKEIPINDEIKAITLYLDLEQLRFKGKFDYSIEVGEGLDASYDEIPSMLIQPYLENAILHGINNKKESGTIRVLLKLEGDFIVCYIEDDGVGRKKAAAMKENRTKAHKSQGMNITQDRLSIINRVNESDLSVKVEDIYDGENTGTRVKIYVPYKNY